MVPDKIYASFINDGKVMAGCSIHPIINSSEYLRKDVLLEWLKERRAEHSFEVRKAYQRTIEKIESL